MRRPIQPIGTAKFLAAWLMPWRPAFLARSKTSKLAFYVHWRDMIGRRLAKYGQYEATLTRWIGEYLAKAPRGIVVDVGANIGWHTVHAAQHSSVETVVAFEPDVFNAWLLDRNLEYNGIDNAIVHVCAVGRERGVIRLYRYKPANLGRHQVMVDYGFGSRLVPMTDLDSSLKDSGFGDRRVTLLKVDVEGYEPAVVAGAKETLERADAVVVEFSPDLSRNAKLSIDEMMDQLLAAGLTPWRLSRDGTLSPADLKALREMKLYVIEVIWLRSPPEA